MSDNYTIKEWNELSNPVKEKKEEETEEDM